ncbi:acyl-CoA dehydrogenase family protein [Pikeienuella sp. HZG-20]|uniref:acyl-CoA dehydrogenase family protein n=1 Tax=Paludibacillus litoralis TaxID=3133267 RepID=UPI0030EE28BF
MELSYTAEEQAFRDEVRGYLAEHLSPRLSEKVAENKRLTKADLVEWHDLLNAKGWLAWHWPKEYGGADWTPVQAHIFHEEIVFANAPRIVPFGVNMLAPVLIKFGTKEQKDHYLPKILTSEHWWCQGYSEPGSGSDLASLKTEAVRDGDHYVVNGQKTWTTLGHIADHIFCLVRTKKDGKPQEGISFLLIPMDTPGVEVRPIITLDGEHEVNEVFLTDVRVPAGNLVGEENKGWTLAKYLLTYERTGIAGAAYSRQAMEHLKSAAKRLKANGKPLREDPFFAARMGKVEIDLMAMDIFNLRILAAAGGGAAGGVESSMLKIRGTEVRQELTDLMRRAFGPHAAPFVPESFDEGWNEEPIGPDGAMLPARTYFNMRKVSIYGGSNEIQKNIISKMGLGL